MNTINDLFKKSFLNHISEGNITVELTVQILFIAALMGLYVLLIYIFSSKKSFYSSTFGKTLVGLTIITTAIILAMQASIVVSLGMVGALSIVRFRNAVKDPLDLLFLFWAISNGIICGTGLFHIAFICNLVMTMVVLGLDFLPFRHASYILVVNGKEDFSEVLLMSAIKKYCNSPKVRTKNVTHQGKEMLVELNLKNSDNLVKECMDVENVESVSLLSHDGEVRY